jgi:hypothetical protein
VTSAVAAASPTTTPASATSAISARAAVPAPAVVPATTTPAPTTSTPKAPASTVARRVVTPIVSAATPAPAQPAPARPAPAPAAAGTPSDGTAPSHASSYAIAQNSPDGTPARFNPCQPIHYVTNLAEAPAGAADDIAGAIARIEAATGINFVNDGSTTEVPSSKRPAAQARYGSSWAPVLVAWSKPGESDLLTGGSVVGQGVTTWVQQQTGTAQPAGKYVYISGQVVIDASSTIHLTPGFGSGQTVGELLLHEMSHVLGLGHSADDTQIMYPQLLPLPSATLGSGDVAGLRRLGLAGGCEDVPNP